MILNSTVLILAYLIGAIPTGAWLSKCYGITDITKHGSGNIGATNVGRLFGATGFIIVFLIDCLKAYFYLLILLWIMVSEWIILIAAMNLLIGNSYSIFLQGRGGKGVATSVGILLALAPTICLIGFACWGVLFSIIKTVGIASVGTYVCLPVIFLTFKPGDPYLKLLVLFMSVWGIFRHRDNIKKYAGNFLKSRNYYF